MNHEHDDLISIDQIMAAAATDYAHVAENTDLIREDVIERVDDALREGLLIDEVPTSAELFRQWVARQFKTTADKNGRSLRNRLRRSLGMQQALDLGDDYELTFTVCSRLALGKEATCGRTTTLGAMNSDDLLFMGAESRINRRDVERADDEVQEALGLWVPTLRQWDDYRSMRRTMGKAGAA